MLLLFCGFLLSVDGDLVEVVFGLVPRLFAERIETEPSASAGQPPGPAIRQGRCDDAAPSTSSTGNADDGKWARFCATDVEAWGGGIAVGEEVARRLEGVPAPSTVGSR